LTKFDVSKNVLRAEGGMVLAASLKGNQVITELNISDNMLSLNPSNGVDISGVAAIADAIPDMGAISSVNVLFNHILKEQAWALANILKEHATLKSLCGNSGNETELDMRGQRGQLGAEGAIMLAPEIIENGALMLLNLSSNNLEAEGGKIVAEAIKVTNNAMGVVLVPFSCTIFMPIWSLAELLLFTAIHRITGR
jgi:hypothetical protein